MTQQEFETQLSDLIAEARKHLDDDDVIAALELAVLTVEDTRIGD